MNADNDEWGNTTSSIFARRVATGVAKAISKADRQLYFERINSKYHQDRSYDYLPNIETRRLYFTGEFNDDIATPLRKLSAEIHDQDVDILSDFNDCGIRIRLSKYIELVNRAYDPSDNLCITIPSLEWLIDINHEEYVVLAIPR